MGTRLTDRDLRILQALATHRVMTTPQVGIVFFHGPYSRVAQRRMLALARKGLVRRFLPPHLEVRPPSHWTLSATGARTLAEALGTASNELEPHSRTDDRLFRSTQLRHTVGVTQTWVDLTVNARKLRGTSVQKWWPEHRCRHAWGNRVRPDAYLRWKQGDTVVDTFLEYDTGTEPHPRLAEKLDRYYLLAQSSGLTSTVLFVVPSTRRLTAMCRNLAAPSSVSAHVTTHEQLTHPGPARPIWRQLGDPTHSVRTLADLG
ncbi:replication-relaxation family protein [Nocardiopsis oceani]